MTLVEIAPWVGGVVFVAAALIMAAKTDAEGKGAWMIPAVFCALFFAWSLWAVTTEGALGFWTEHTRNKWGVQIWFDLLLAVGVGWFLIVPQAKRLGMNVYLWLVFILSSGSIGFLAMLSRFLFLKEKKGA